MGIIDQIKVTQRKYSESTLLWFRVRYRKKESFYNLLSVMTRSKAKRIFARLRIENGVCRYYIGIPQNFRDSISMVATQKRVSLSPVETIPNMIQGDYMELDPSQNGLLGTLLDVDSIDLCYTSDGVLFVKKLERNESVENESVENDEETDLVLSDHDDDQGVDLIIVDAPVLFCLDDKGKEKNRKQQRKWVYPTVCFGIQTSFGMVSDHAPDKTGSFFIGTTTDNNVPVRRDKLSIVGKPANVELFLSQVIENFMENTPLVVIDAQGLVLERITKTFTYKRLESQKRVLRLDSNIVGLGGLTPYPRMNDLETDLVWWKWWLRRRGVRTSAFHILDDAYRDLKWKDLGAWVRSLSRSKLSQMDRQMYQRVLSFSEENPMIKEWFTHRVINLKKHLDSNSVVFIHIPQKKYGNKLNTILFDTAIVNAVLTGYPIVVIPPKSYKQGHTLFDLCDSPLILSRRITTDHPQLVLRLDSDRANKIAQIYGDSSLSEHSVHIPRDIGIMIEDGKLFSLNLSIDDPDKVKRDKAALAAMME